MRVYVVFIEDGEGYFVPRWASTNKESIASSIHMHQRHYSDLICIWLDISKEGPWPDDFFWGSGCISNIAAADSIEDVTPWA